MLKDHGAVPFDVFDDERLDGAPLAIVGLHALLVALADDWGLVDGRLERIAGRLRVDVDELRVAVDELVRRGVLAFYEAAEVRVCEVVGFHDYIGHPKRLYPSDRIPSRFPMRDGQFVQRSPRKRPGGRLHSQFETQQIAHPRPASASESTQQVAPSEVEAEKTAIPNVSVAIPSVTECPSDARPGSEEINQRFKSGSSAPAERATECERDSQFEAARAPSEDCPSNSEWHSQYYDGVATELQEGALHARVRPGAQARARVLVSNILYGPPPHRGGPIYRTPKPPPSAIPHAPLGGGARDGSTTREQGPLSPGSSVQAPNALPPEPLAVVAPAKTVTEDENAVEWRPSGADIMRAAIERARAKAAGAPTPAPVDREERQRRSVYAALRWPNGDAERVAFELADLTAGKKLHKRDSTLLMLSGLAMEWPGVFAERCRAIVALGDAWHGWEGDPWDGFERAMVVDAENDLPEESP